MPRIREVSWPSPPQRAANDLYAPATNATLETDLDAELDAAGRLPFAQTMWWLLCLAIIGWAIVAASVWIVWRLIF